MKTISTKALLATVALSTSVASANTDMQNIDMPSSIKIATFNVSMEALNYIERGQKPVGNELSKQLMSDNQQVKNVAEIIQRINPDILLLNEFDRLDDSGKDLQTFIKQYLNVGQNGQQAIDYPYVFQGPVNTGLKTPFDINGDGKITQPQDTYGFGHFTGHFAMALLSKYPIVQEQVRTFQTFKWQDMPGALKPINPSDGSSYYPEDVWKQLRLSSKSHWDIPVKVENKTISVLASHPTPPVFDGEEDRNGKRNHDEIRFWVDYLTPKNADYIYDDKGTRGGKSNNNSFVLMGDLNASNMDGDAIYSGIGALLNHLDVFDPMPTSKGGDVHKLDNANSKYHTAYWGMRADYVLPSKHGWTVKDSGVFWPTKEDSLYRLIESRAASSDHRLVWVELTLEQSQN